LFRRRANPEGTRVPLPDDIHQQNERIDTIALEAILSLATI